MSPDPMGEFFNPYSYTGGNPIGLTDPDGLMTWKGILATVLVNVAGAVTLVATAGNVGFGGYWDDETGEWKLLAGGIGIGGGEIGGNTKTGAFEFMFAPVIPGNNNDEEEPVESNPQIPVQQPEEQEQYNPGGILADGQTGTGGGTNITLQLPDATFGYPITTLSTHTEYGRVPVYGSIAEPRWNYDYANADNAILNAASGGYSGWRGQTAQYLYSFTESANKYSGTMGLIGTGLLMSGVGSELCEIPFTASVLGFSAGLVTGIGADVLTHQYSNLENRIAFALPQYFVNYSKVQALNEAIKGATGELLNIPVKNELP
jgi:hypothetical protein